MAEKRQVENLVAEERQGENLVPEERQVENLVAQTGKIKIEWIKDQRLHLLRRPDMYISQVTSEERKGMGLLPCNPKGATTEESAAGEQAKSKEKTMFRTSTYVAEVSPALLKIFDEVMVNALDNAFNDASQKNIKVAIDQETGRISVTNDGKGLPDSLFEESGKHMISVIFSKFNSGSNLSDEDSFTGGRNGLGVVCTNVMCLEFDVESACVETKSLFTQSFRQNMATVGVPKIKKFYGKAGWVKVSLLPDYARLDMPSVVKNGLSRDVLAALNGRVMDAAVCTSLRKCNVLLANAPIAPPPSKAEYAKLTITDPVQMLHATLGTTKASQTIANDIVADNAKSICLMNIAVTTVSPEDATRMEEHGGRFVGFVNGVRCPAGTHMTHITNQLVKLVRAKVLAKTKKGDDITVRPKAILSRLAIVVTCLVAKTQFTSQTKEQLSTKDLGFQWQPSDAFVRTLCEKTALVADVLLAVTEKQTTQLQKGVGGRASVNRIEKYDPPAKGGKGKPTLLTVEGDSAKAFAVAGLSAVGRTGHGVFPIGGKLINVRSNSELKVSANKEVNDLCNILGLKPGEHYTAEKVAKLKYGSITFLADQDADGVHIMGLLINFFHYSFPSLLECKPDFCRRFFTPLVKAILPSTREEKSFYSIRALKDWQVSSERNKRCELRYYKGLGSSTSQEARDCFQHELDHTMVLSYSGDQCDKALCLYFDSKKTAERKQLIGDTYDENDQLDFSAKRVTFNEIVRKDLVHFARYDTERSIPSMVDGFKIVTRKVMHFAFHKLKGRTKVAQMGAAAACFAAYHHGEVSICDAVCGLAQEYVGTNNIALLLPEGQFGNRHNKPSVHAATRYIHTRLQPIANKVFRPEDIPLLEHLSDEGVSIEPKYYVPVVPFVLINSASGIGTGYSTSVPPFKPSDIIDASRKMAKNHQADINELVPWFDGFDGTITQSHNGYTTRGIFALSDDRQTLTITELPVGVWIESYVDFVKQTLMVEDNKKRKADTSPGIGPLVREIFNGSSEHKVHLELTLDAAVAAAMFTNDEAIVKICRLASPVCMSNMWLFDEHKQLVKVNDVREIVRHHARLRLALYDSRLQYLIAAKRKEIVVTDEVLRFVTLVVQDTIVIFKRQMQDVVRDLEAHNFVKRENSTSAADFSHLLRMHISNFTADKITELATKLDRLKAELTTLEATTPQSLWLLELADLESAYAQYKLDKDVRHGQGNTDVSRNKPKKRSAAGAQRTKKKTKRQ